VYDISGEKNSFCAISGVVSLKFRLSKQRAFFRVHINTAQTLLNVAARGSKQGAFRARTNTEKNAVKNEILVM